MTLVFDTHEHLGRPRTPFGGCVCLRIALFFGSQHGRDRKYTPRPWRSSSLVSSPRTSRRVINACLRLEFPANVWLELEVGTAFKSGTWLGDEAETTGIAMRGERE